MKGSSPRNELVENDLNSLNPGDEVEVFIEKLSDSDGLCKAFKTKS